MRFLRRNTAEKTPDDAAGSVTDLTEGSGVGNRAHTPGKGKPTPKRREAEGRRRGPVPAPPKNTREAMRRAKLTGGNKEERRAAARDRRERMMAGEDKYLLPRDRGPIKAYVRDVVDSRRRLVGLFMPLALVVIVAMLIPDPQLQSYVTLGCMAMLLLMIVDGVLNGRKIAKMVRERFPKETIRGGSIGWYAFVRASQVRKLRTPRARVRPGEPIPQ